MISISSTEVKIISNITDVTKEFYNKIYAMVIEDWKSCASTRSFSISITNADTLIVTDVLVNVIDYIRLKNPNFLSYINYDVAYNSSIYKNTGLKIASVVRYYYSLSKDVIDAQCQFLNSVLQRIEEETKYLKTGLDVILFLCNYFKKENFTIYEFDGSITNDVYSIFYNKTANYFVYNYALGYLFTCFNIEYQYFYYNNNSSLGISVYLNSEWYFIDIGMELYHLDNCFILKSLNNEMFGTDTTYDYFSDIQYLIMGAGWELTPNEYSTRYDWLELR